MNNNFFQTALMVIFIVGAIVAVLIFAGFIKVGKDKTAIQGKVIVWGTFKSTDLSGIVETASGKAGSGLTVTYVQKDKANYQNDLINAFAKDKAPDLFIITPDMMIKNESFIYKIPYESYSEKTYRDTFVDGADIYLASDGIVGFPIAIDPMVMYYNKNMFSNEGIAAVPSYWDELLNLNSRLTKKEDDGTITKSMIAMGQYSNISNSKDIIATLMIQSGNSIISRTDKGYISIIKENPLSLPESPIGSVFSFFTGFSNPTTDIYSWNKGMSDSFDMFVNDNLAMYLGHASELFKIEETNPNLSFDVKMIPQAKGVPYKKTSADIYAVVVSKKSLNMTAAFSLASRLSSGDLASSFAEAVSLAPTSRALLSVKQKEPYLETFFNSAIISRSWIDPDSNGSDLIFNEVLDNILSNKLITNEAFTKADGQLNKLIKNNYEK